MMRTVQTVWVGKRRPKSARNMRCLMIELSCGHTLRRPLGGPWPACRVHCHHCEALFDAIRAAVREAMQPA